jgi:sec-independent protein translocase protein TatB
MAPCVLDSRGMFGMGIGEIVVIIVVALLFIGPEKLPEAAKSLSKGIRDIRKQTRELRETIEDDTEFGGAIRDLQSALRGEDPHAAAEARRRIAAHKIKSGTDAGAATATSQLAAGALAPETPASNVETAGTTPASPVPGTPVIAASPGAVARGAAIPAPGTTPEPTAGDGAADPTVPQPTPERAHG